MSNQNTVCGYYNVPSQVIGAVSTEIALLVPPTGTYPGTPSPLFQPQTVSSVSYQPGLSLAAPQDLVAGGALDGHKFVVRHTGRIINPASAVNVTFKMYTVPATNVGTVSATGSVTTAKAPGSSDVAMAGPTAFTTPASGSYFVEYQLIWDSVNGKINGIAFGQASNSAYQAPVAITQAAVTTLSDMNFLPTVTFAATAQATAAWIVDEFVIERV